LQGDRKSSQLSTAGKTIWPKANQLAVIAINQQKKRGKSRAALSDFFPLSITEITKLWLKWAHRDLSY